MTLLQKFLADIGAEFAELMTVKGFVPETKKGVRQSLDLADEQAKVTAVVKKTI